MYSRHSLLPSVLFLILASSRNAFATHRLACNIPRNFTVDLTSDETANFYESELTISLEKDALVVTSYQGTNAINVRGRENVVVNFKGNLIMNNAGLEIATKPERISQTYKDRISGIAQRSLLNSAESTINRCRLVLLPSEMDWPNVHQRIANEIRRLAESCVELEICPRLDEIPVRSEIRPPRELSMYSTDPLELAAASQKYFGPEDCDDNVYSNTVQLAINKVVDVALSEVIAKLIEQQAGPIIVPDIDQEFHLGSGVFRTTGYFEAVNGTFRDLSTIRRILDATLSHDGMKFMASCAFGLTIADLKYSHYKLKYGLIKVNGKMSGNVDGAALTARIAVDYNHTPCLVSMDYLKVTEFGKLTVDLTGLGPLNSAASAIINWITKTWRDDIIRTVETEMRASVESQLSALDCEKFRP